MTTSSMHIAITPAKLTPKGQRYEVRLGAELLITSRTPLLAAARELEKRGHSPATILTMSHAGSDTVSLQSTLGTAAKLTVIENETAGPRFGRYRAPPAHIPIAVVRGRGRTAENSGSAGVACEIAGRRSMSDTVTQSPAEPDPATIARIQAQLTALRAAGMLSPEGCRLLARAEAVEVANREMAELRRRLEERLREIDEQAARARRGLQ